MMEFARQIRYMGIYATLCGEGGTNATVYLLLLLAGCIAAYLLGSINSAILISRAKYHEDIRNYGSKNAGMTNMLRTYGKGAGILTLVLDMLKAVLSVLIAVLLAGQDGGYCAMVFCMLGHMFPLYFHFKGGKGVAVAAASILCLEPLAFLVMVVVFAAVVAMTKYVSLGSVMAALLYPLFLNRLYLLLHGSDPGIFVSGASLIAALLVVIMHRENIRRLLAGKEAKLDLNGRKKEEK